MAWRCGPSSMTRSTASVVAIGETVPAALDAADALAGDVDAEVIDPRTLLPLDEDAIARSVRKTGRLVVADPANRTCGVAAELAALIGVEQGIEPRLRRRGVERDEGPHPGQPRGSPGPDCERR